MRMLLPAVVGGFVLLTLLAEAHPTPTAGLPAPWRWDRITGLSHWHHARMGETLRRLADRYGVAAHRLGIVNRWPLDTPLPAGSRVWIGDLRIVPGRPGSGLLVNLPEQRLDVVLDGRLRASWPVAIGAPDWPTPTGHFRLAPPQRDPTWLVPPRIRAEFARQGRPLPARVVAGPGNPLGRVWLGLMGSEGVGIHAAPGPGAGHGSHGCLRLSPDAAMQLAAWWRPGLAVDVVDLPVKIFQDRGRRWCERHPDPYRTDGSDAEAIGIPLAPSEAR